MTSRNNLQHKLRIGSIVSYLGITYVVQELKYKWGCWNMPRAERASWTHARIFINNESVWINTENLELLSYRETT